MNAHAYVTHMPSIHAGISLHVQILDRKGKGLLFCTSVQQREYIGKWGRLGHPHHITWSVCRRAAQP